jgi:cytochrome P450
MSTNQVRVTETEELAACAAGSVGGDFRPFSDEYQRDPYPFFARARREEPVFYSPDMDAYVVTRYEDCLAVLRDPETFSAKEVLEFVKPLCPAALEPLVQAGFVPGATTVNEDDPEHRPHRDVLRGAFTNERLQALEPKVRGWVATYVDRFVRRGHADLVMELMWEIPALAALELMGVPEAEVERAKTFAVRRNTLNFGRPSEDEQVEHARGIAEFWRYCVQHVDRTWEQPNASFLSEMIELAKDPAYEGVLDRIYIYRMCMNILFAGHETTTNGSANAFLCLLEAPDQWQRIVADPTLIPNAVEETLRLRSAAPVWRRRTTREAEIGGAAIPAEMPVLVAFGSANRDEARFPDPDRLDVGRADARQHLTFGWGRHKCLGQNMARMEIRLALEELTRRLPHMALAPEQTFEYQYNILFRGPQHVHVRWDPGLNPRPEDRPGA